MLTALIDSLRRGVPAALEELAQLAAPFGADAPTCWPTSTTTPPTDKIGGNCDFAETPVRVVYREFYSGTHERDVDESRSLESPTRADGHGCHW
jgi:hypothetical protein